VSTENGRAAFGIKGAELAVAGFLGVLGAIVIVDSVRLGFRWGSDGPQAGYFPFYVGLIIVIASVVNAVHALRVPRGKAKAFVQVEQLKLVLAVLVPTAVYVGLIAFIGLYEASVLFVAGFMLWMGKYGWGTTAAVSLGNSLFFLVIFEIWFKIPLPKSAVSEWAVKMLKPVVEGAVGAVQAGFGVVQKLF
jgi:putative tricarboxylic transport membrane protein